LSLAGKARVFAEPESGFVIHYPADWVIERPAGPTVVFSGKPGTPAYYATVSVRTTGAPTATDPVRAAAAALADLKGQMAAETTDLQYLGEGPVLYKKDRLNLEGRQIMATYTYRGNRFRKWVVVVPRPSTMVAHVWSYTAPEARYHEYRSIAQAMLETLTIQMPAAAPPGGADMTKIPGPPPPSAGGKR